MTDRAIRSLQTSKKENVVSERPAATDDAASGESVTQPVAQLHHSFLRNAHVGGAERRGAVSMPSEGSDPAGNSTSMCHGHDRKMHLIPKVTNMLRS